MSNNINSFISKLVSRLGDYYGKEYFVSSSEYVKNNGTIKHAVIIRKKGEHITPTIYVDDFFDDYNEGISFSEIVAEIIKIRDEHGNDIEIDLSYIDKYDLVKDKLYIKLINKEYNTGILKDVPYVCFADMLVVFLLKVSDVTIGEGEILIHNDLFLKWNITTEELYQDAKKNTMDRFGPSLFDMVDILKELATKNNCKLDMNNLTDNIAILNDNEEKMYVLTNQSKWHGAAVITYNNLLKDLADSFNNDFYILPSSIHEVLIVPYKNSEDGHLYTSMVREVNMSSLLREEVLSEHAYRYHRASNWLEPIIP